MIDLHKKYKTNHGWDVVLLDIVENTVFGRYYNPALQQWYSTEWKISTGKCQFVSAIGDNYNLVEVPEFKVISEVVPQYKTVKYFDFDIIVPVWVNYIATESDGNVIGFNRSPVLGCKDLSWNNDKLYYQNATKVLAITFDGDWRKSLMEIK